MKRERKKLSYLNDYKRGTMNHQVLKDDYKSLKSIKLSFFPNLIDRKREAAKKLLLHHFSIT